MTTPSDEKLLAEAEKLRAEAKEITRHPFSRPGTWIPLLLAFGTGVGGLLTGYYQWRIKEIEVSNAIGEAEDARRAAEKEELQFRQEAFVLVKRNAQLEDELTSKTNAIALATANLELIQQQIQQARIERDGPAEIDGIDNTLIALGNAASGISQSLNRPQSVVYIQFRGGISREKVQGLQSLVRETGTNVPPAERVSGEYDTSVRYFHAEDREFANEISLQVGKFLSSACGINDEIPVSMLNLQAPIQQVEVWLSANCPD